MSSIELRLLDNRKYAWNNKGIQRKHIVVLKL